ncbi:GTP-binding protein [Thiocapsa sp.]|uniref:GTP-binding protein n=1 Tax=Thiocapsa sp. TaxID=2024551 RepID=UPI003593C696
MTHHESFLSTDSACGLIPVTLLTGFLGSGKTTVLNHLVRQPELADALVIINEFGEMALDHGALAQRRSLYSTFNARARPRTPCPRSQPGWPRSPCT